MSIEENVAEYEEINEDAVPIKPLVIVDKPLTPEIAAKSLSLLSKIGYGFSHAFIKFKCVNKAITDIAILVQFPFLRFVTLSGNYISDLSPLSAAEYLMYLKSDHNQILQAGSLKTLNYLQYFDLSHNKVASTDYINHGRLKHLILNYNEISTLKGVNGPPLNQFKLRSLETLEIRGNQIESTEGLGFLHDLKTLYFGENLLKSVEDISGLRGLVRLHLRDNHIATLDGFLQGPTKLEYLNLRGNKINRWSEVKKLKSLVTLKVLVLSDNPIADRDLYRPVVLGMMPFLTRLDKDKTTEEEIAEAVDFYVKLPENALELEDEEEARLHEHLAETKLEDGGEVEGENTGVEATPRQNSEGAEENEEED